MQQPDLFSMNSLHILIKEPNDLKKKALIDHVAQKVAEDGFIFQESLKYQGQQFLELSFMTPSPDQAELYNYYKWKVFSIISGDSITSWREEPFRISKSGPIWVPPQNQSTKQKRREQQETMRQDSKLKGKQKIGGSELITAERQQLNQIIENLKPTKNSICRAMMFAIDHSDCSFEVMEIIHERIKETNDESFQKIITICYLISDVLRNSSAHSVPGAWSYRNAIQSLLPEIFQLLNLKLRQTSGMMTKKQAMSKLVNLINIWNQWGVFGKQYSEGIEFILNRSDESNILYEILCETDDLSKSKDDEHNRMLLQIGPQIRKFYNQIVSQGAKDAQKLINTARMRGVPHKRKIQDILQLLAYVQYRALQKEYKSKVRIQLFATNQTSPIQIQFQKDLKINNILNTIDNNNSNSNNQNTQLQNEQLKVDQQLLALRDQFEYIQKIKLNIDTSNLDGQSISEQQASNLCELLEVDYFLESAPGKKKALKIEASKALNQESGGEDDDEQDEQEEEDIDGVSLTTQDQELLSKLELKDGQVYVELKYPILDGEKQNLQVQSQQNKQRAVELSTQIDAQLALLGDLDGLL